SKWSSGNGSRLPVWMRCCRNRLTHPYHSSTLTPSMKFAFSTLCTPTWDFATIAARAKEYGYDGVEIRGFLNESILTASNIFLTDPRKVREIFKEQNIAIACLSSSIAFTANRRRDKQGAQDLMTFVDTARQLDCPMVKISDTQTRPGSRDESAAALARWLSPLG